VIAFLYINLYNLNMLWLILALLSAFCLGIYDIFKKWSLRKNPVMPVLLIATLTGALIFLPFIVGSASGAIAATDFFYVPAYPLKVHGLFFLKSIIVGSSWILAYYALKHLPITIVTPVRSTAPVWVLIGAIILFHEQLNPVQWLGLMVTFVFFYAFSLAGKKEGIVFQKNKWILFIVLATLIGSASSLFDKWLLMRYDRLAVQAWFSVYLVVFMLPSVYFIWYPKRKLQPLVWTWAIPFIGITLTIADFLYFYALQLDDSLISIISTIRRSSVIYSFFIGAYVFKEQNITRKALLLIGILAGIILIMSGS
jgi:bacterial/archaeal transporter family protein